MADSRIDPAAWIAADPDPKSRAELQSLATDPARTQEFDERFSDTLRFGTAGLRGPLRAGPLGMNVAVVMRASHALGRWLTEHGHRGASVVVGRDARHGSADLAAASAEVLAAQGFDVVVLPDPTPTPLIAFACRDLSAAAAVAITASHNPPGDNGYKVYLDDGAQLIPPADREIEALITTAPPANTIARANVAPDSRSGANAGRYLDRLLRRFGGVSESPVRIAVTPLHGVGGETILDALRAAGFDDLHVVSEQFAPDPDFPTVRFPNPEEPCATDRLLALARRVGADLAVAVDPDADRCAVGTVIHGHWRMLTGDETGALLGAYLLAHTDVAAPVVASTIVSGSLLADIATAAGARHERTLTGFKWLVRAGDPLLYCYEEAIGHCTHPDAVRDKDGISAAVVAALLTHERVAATSDLSAALDELALAHGVHVTTARSVRVDDVDAIADLMAGLRGSPPHTLAGIVVSVEDYATRTDALCTDAVQFTGCSDGVRLRVIARPSGTEPKLKYYLELVDPDRSDIARTTERLHRLAAAVTSELPPAISHPSGPQRGPN